MMVIHLRLENKQGITGKPSPNTKRDSKMMERRWRK